MWPSVTMLVVGWLVAGSVRTEPGPLSCLPDDDFLVRIEQGLIRGCKLRSRAGRTIVAFRGIRYGKAPVGNLRFADPEPAESWDEEVQDTIADGPMCIQKNYLLPNPSVEGDEDCLFLNVYTNKIPSRNDNVRTRRPVMVYIHGGGFFAGTGSSYLNGPDYLLDEDIVLVTLNYRLGVMGFLSTNDDAAAGNWGLKDQVLALRWVQDNIDKFGGDPDKVTIFGQSAGAASVHYLVLSPATEGLFHQAISQSGSALNLWATPTNSLTIANIQGVFVGCPSNKTSELVECFRNTDAKTLIDSGDKFKFWDVDPLAVYIPSLEKKTEKNKYPLITEHPSKALENGNFNKVPYIMGVMENEGIIRAAPISTQKKLRSDLNSRWDELGPELFVLSASVPEDKILPLWKNFTKFYMPKDKGINEKDSQSVQNFVNMYSDRSFVYGVYQAAKGHAKYAPVYVYKIDYAGQYSYAPIFKGTNETINYKFEVSHCDDLIYLFRTPVLFPPTSGVDTDFSRVLVKMWTAFARDGAPFGKFWTPLIHGLSDTKFRHLQMSGPNPNAGKRDQIQLQMRMDFFPERMAFWRSQDVNENR